MVDPGIIRTRVYEDDRRLILDRELYDRIAGGDLVLARLPDQAVLTTGKPVNHLVHFVLSFCCWLWVPVWLVLWLFGGERAVTVEVDEYGTLRARIQRMGWARCC